VTELNVDFYLAGVLKWMCGGPGGVFLYARPDYLKTVEPKLTGWMATRSRLASLWMIWTSATTPSRFLNGTLAVPSLYANRPGVEIIAQVGVENIRRKSLHQTALLAELAEAAGYAINSPRRPEERGGTVTINPPHAYEVSRELLARDVIIDYRAQAGIRVSPHFYNSDDEVQLVIDTIKDYPDQRRMGTARGRTGLCHVEAKTGTKLRQKGNNHERACYVRYQPDCFSNARCVAGDTPFSYTHTLRLSEGAAVNLTTWTLSAHTGTHMDAPYHYVEESYTRRICHLMFISPGDVVTITRREGGQLSRRISRGGA